MWSFHIVSSTFREGYKESLQSYDLWLLNLWRICGQQIWPNLKKFGQNGHMVKVKFMVVFMMTFKC